MDNIKYLKHCTYKGLENILKCEYIKSGYELGKEKDYGDPTKVFLQIEGYKNECTSLDYN